MADKKFRIVTVALTVMAVCLLTLYGGISHASVVGTPHDLSWVGPKIQYMTQQVCVFCHTPHGGNTNINQSTYWNSTGYQNTGGDGSFLLWNRALSSLPASGFATYQSSTLDVDTSQVRSYSLLCMSCHDGVSALNVMVNQPNEYASYWGEDPFSGAALNRWPSTETENQIGDICVDCGPNIGDMNPSGSTVINLANDHPVSFDYLDSNPDVVNLALKNRASINTALKFFPSPETGNNDSVECSTCHNPHEWGTGATKPFLRMTNAGSQMCLACHTK